LSKIFGSDNHKQWSNVCMCVSSLIKSQSDVQVIIKLVLCGKNNTKSTSMYISMLDMLTINSLATFGCAVIGQHFLMAILEWYETKTVLVSVGA